ncbi:MAG: hypothetical protein V3R67_03475 [Thermodesulfobacteriota bacterium]
MPHSNNENDSKTTGALPKLDLKTTDQQPNLKQTESNSTLTTDQRPSVKSKTTDQRLTVVENDRPATPKQLDTTIDGQLVLGSLQDQMSFAQRLIDTKMVGKSFKSAQQVVIGIQYAKSLTMDVIPALKMMFVLNGTPSLYGDGPLAMCQRTGLVHAFEEFWVDKDCKQICFKNKNLNAEVYAAICRVRRQGDSKWQEDFFSIDDLTRAGISQDQYGEKAVWKKFKRIMMRYKARTLALKSKFADKLNGIGIMEYDQHATQEVPESLVPEKALITQQINSDVDMLT